MSNEIEKLLAVLDLPEDSPEQYGWLLSTIREHKACCPSDLAFRLRDKVVNKTNLWWITRLRVYHWYLEKEGKEETISEQYKNCDIWWMSVAKPVHWVIAALIAKQLQKEANETAERNKKD